MAKARIRGSYVSQACAKRLKSYCAVTNTTESAVVEAALNQYLAGTSEHTALFRRLDRLDRTIKRAHRDAMFYGEAFAEHVRVWYAYTPELPDPAKSSAAQQSARRYQFFVRQLAQRLGSGRSLIHELAIDDEIAEPTELERARLEFAAE